MTDPRIKAVGFTGSRSGGTALVAAAAARPEPIPVYAEMSSINPVFLLDGALATRGADLGRYVRAVEAVDSSARSPWAPASSAPTPAW